MVGHRCGERSGRDRVAFFFNDTATTEIYTLSLHDALPISAKATGSASERCSSSTVTESFGGATSRPSRSEEHTSELQSQSNLVCRLLLEKKQAAVYTRAIDGARPCHAGHVAPPLIASPRLA